MHLKKTLFALLLSGPVFIAACSDAKAQQQASKDSITIAVAPEYNSVGAFHRFWLGESYRKVWATPVKMRVIDLQKEKGGLKIVKLGGGMQTRSLRLADPTGKEWALRTVQKYPEQGMAENLRGTIAKDIAQDQVSTNHPFASLVVPTLAAALSIPHSKPEIVYVGDDPGLGEYRKDFANAVYLIEERSPFEKETDNTEKVQRKIQQNNDNKADQKLTLRARMLDFLLGDWDRHEDNWRWLAEKDKDKGEAAYIPVPRDRDKVFYKTTGVFPWVLTHQWLKTHLQPYSGNIRDVDHWSFNERYFDRYFLNELNQQDWKDAASYVQQKLSSEVILQAFQQMPDTVFKLDGQELIRNFTSRRDKLDSLTQHYYRFLSIHVDVPASEKKELIKVSNLDNGDVEVQVHNINKAGKQGRLVYKRTFDRHITKEVRIFGISGEDTFFVEGAARSAIRVRLIGGPLANRYEVAAGVRNKPFIYDQPDTSNHFPARALAKFRLAGDTLVNRFDKNSFLYDRSGVLFNGGYNIDQGIQIGLGYVIEKQGFRKDPYARKHEFWVNYNSGRRSFILDYVSDFKKAIGNNDLTIHANLLGPNNLSNFFGLGNNTENIDHDFEEDNGDPDREDGISYYRNRYNYLNADIRLGRQLAGHLRADAGLLLSYYSSSASGNDERFFTDFNAAYPEQEIFSNKLYGGLVAGLVYDSRDNISVPKKGVFWKANLVAQHKLHQGSDKYGAATAEFRFYLNPGKSGLVIANRTGGGTTIGNPTFFQRMQLGGVNSLRGFNSKRFTGTSMFYNNLDLRLKLFNFTSYLVPGTVGMIGFTDVGRVWEKGEHSNRWHQGYGGGLYVMPGEVILLQASVGASKEASMLYLSVGFNF
ncbi:BamA/TamA family outer membrane protein [Pedobacter heparinus]|uniref:BamA/TamA family outer membrane protein n=1 Tax=Pedobacter heparinus TaxID=984 RepID=UPI00293008EC|nr:BamA/TamA family outer membrane protein [Pedobacter heparinus]